MQQRGQQQLHECVELAGELMPMLPTDGIFEANKWMVDVDSMQMTVHDTPAAAAQIPTTATRWRHASAADGGATMTTFAFADAQALEVSVNSA